MNKNILLIVIFSLIVFSLQAQIKCKGEKGMSSQTSSAAGCVAASASALMDINNVQAIYFNAGDMWWDMPNGGPHYEVPKGSGKHSLFFGSIWMGGVDDNGQIRVFAQKYRQNGNDNWPGPLKSTGPDNGTVTPICAFDMIKCM